MIRARRSAPARRRAALALLLALLVPAAPMARTTGSACEVCPRDCPMHSKSAHGDHRGCHRIAAAPPAAESSAPGWQRRPQAGRETPPSRGGFLRRPGCGSRRELPRAWLVEALPAPVAVSWYLPRQRNVGVQSPAADLRPADPPASPPPIVAS